MLTKITRVDHTKGLRLPILVTEWKFLGIPVFVSKAINP
jgi:hypothetical protein